MAEINIDGQVGQQNHISVQTESISPKTILQIHRRIKEELQLNQHLKSLSLHPKPDYFNFIYNVQSPTAGGIHTITNMQGGTCYNFKQSQVQFEATIF